MSNSINIDQNKKTNLELLAAQRQLYSDTKVTQEIQLVIVVLIPILFALIVYVFQELRVWASLYGFCALLADALVLDSLAQEKRKTAARIQELFDSIVLNFEWNSLCVGAKPNPETISQTSRSYLQREGGFDALKDWYPQGLESLPCGLARLLCQRTNCWWDSDLRRKYRASLYGVLAVIFFIGVGVTIIVGASLQDFILMFLAPLSPVFLIAIRIAKKQGEIIGASDNFRKFADNLWNDALRNKLSESELKAFSRQLQNEIFVHRCNKEQVPDWFYKLFRESQQLNMEEATKRMIDEAKVSSIS